MYSNFLQNCVFTILVFFVSCKKDTNLNNKVITNPTTLGAESWMEELIDMYPEDVVTLRKIMIPAAHDAGMYMLRNCSFGANACNTQTQKLDFYTMLMQGVRAFDVRPSFAGGKYFTEHSTGCGGLGCKGDLLANIYADINIFLENHEELVILEMSHFCGTHLEDEVLLDMATNIFGDKLHRGLPLTESLLNIPLNEIIGNSGKGKVLIIYEGASNDMVNRNKGVYAPAVLPKEGAWTNSPNLPHMLYNQLSLYENYSNSSAVLFQFNWQITQSTLQAVNCAINPLSVPISKTADSANMMLQPIMDSLITIGNIRHGRIPNILYFDFCESKYAKTCIDISLLNFR